MSVCAAPVRTRLKSSSALCSLVYFPRLGVQGHNMTCAHRLGCPCRRHAAPEAQTAVPMAESRVLCVFQLSDRIASLPQQGHLVPP